jgi:hypothetical protein
MISKAGFGFSLVVILLRIGQGEIAPMSLIAFCSALAFVTIRPAKEQGFAVAARAPFGLSRFRYHAVLGGRVLLSSRALVGGSSAS